VDIVLDVGAGDGWLAAELEDRNLARRAFPAEVSLRRRVVRKPVLYDGARLPIADRGVELVLAVDVLHHLERPEAGLRELLRCARRFVLLKDHTFRTAPERWTLWLLDVLGNLRFGVHSPGNYQRELSWISEAEAQGFVVRKLVHPAPVQVGLIGRLTNHLQFVALLERQGERSDR
jgi:SAM-dependent methyltransferase